MFAFKIRTTFFISLIFSLVVNAQSPGPMVTDRPDQTESSSTVPLKSVQIETGISMEMDQFESAFVDIESRVFSLASTLIRYGIHERVELRLGGEFISQKTEAGQSEVTTSGFAGASIGTKLYLFEEKGARPEAAVIVDAAVPIGKDELTPDRFEPGFLFSLSHSISETVGFGYNLGGLWPEGVNFIGRYSAVVGISANEKTGIFLEVYGEFPQNDRRQFLYDAGMTYQLQPNVQFDVSAGAAVTELAPDYFINAGISLRLPQ